MINETLSLFSLSGLLIFCTFPILTILSIKNRRSNLHFIWAIFNVTVGIWGLGAFLVGIAKDEQSAFLYWKLAHLGIIFIPILYFHVSSVFCELTNRKIVALLYLQGFFFLLLNISGKLFQNDLRYIFSSLYYIKPTYWYYVFFTIWVLAAFWGTFNYIHAYFRFTGLKKTQLKYFILATIFGFSGGLMNFMPVFNINIFPYGNFLVPIFPIVVTYTILRYRLMDINIVFKKTAAYSLSIGVLTGFFVIFILAITKYFVNFAHVTSFTITAIAALIIAFLFNPIRKRIHAIIDKKFFKNTYDYYSTIQKVSHELASTFSLGKIYSFMGDVILSALGLRDISFLSLVPGGNYVMVHSLSFSGKGAVKDKETMSIDTGSAVGTQNTKGRMRESEKAINGNSGIIELLKTRDVIIREELPRLHKIKQEVVDKVNADLKPFKGEAVVPVFIDDKLELVMILGEKISGDIFTSEDIKLLHTISDQTAIAIKNAKLYMDKLTSDRLASIGMVSATFAHEIKNPLTSIKTFAQLLPERYSDIDFRENFSKIVVDSANRIDGLIRDLLDFSSGRTPAEMSTLNIAGFMDRIIDEARANLKLNNKKITIEKDYENINIDVLGDEKKLSQAFINVILNGCQSIPDDRNDGTLKVGINQNKENVDISIADNGDGIPAEDVTKIFEPFFSTKTIGAGLGLAITKKIIEDHCGRIVVDSTFKKGTTFEITLPVKKAEVKGGNFSSTK